MSEVQEPVSPEESADAVMESVDAANQEGGVVGQEQPAEGHEDVQDASDEDLAEVVSDEESTEEEVAEAKQELARRLSLKINGQEKEFDLSSDDDLEQIKQMAQKGEGADQKFQEAAKIQKQMNAFLELMQQDPIRALQELGHDPDKIAETHMQRRIEEMQKSPEQLELEKLRKQIEDEKKARETLEEEKFRAEQERIQEEYSRKLDVEITDALESSELPKSAYVVKRLAENLMIGLEKNPDITVADVLPIVEKQIKGEIQQMFGAMPEEVVEKILGEDTSNRLRKRRLNKMKKPPQTASQVKSTGNAEIKKAQAEAARNEKPKSAKDFFKDIGSF